MIPWSIIRALFYCHVFKALWFILSSKTTTEMSSTRVTGTKNMLLVRTALTIPVLSNLVLSLINRLPVKNLPVSSPLSRWLGHSYPGSTQSSFMIWMFLFSFKVNKSEQYFFFTVSWICISLMLQQQEVTLVWDLCLQNKGGKTGFEKCKERNSDTFVSRV